MSTAQHQQIDTDDVATAMGYLHLDFDPASIARLTKLDGWFFCDDQRYDLKHIDNLPRNYVWLSNLDLLEHQALVGPTRPHIKSARFLPMALDQIRGELALKNADDTQFASLLVRFGDNLLRLCQHTYQGDFLRNLTLHPTFAQAIAACIGMNQRQQPKFDDELHTRIIWENLHEQTQLNKEDPNLPLVCLRVPMYRHTNALLKCPLPSESQPWREVKVSASSANEFFSREDIPSVVQVTALKLPTQLEGIYPTHSGLRYSHKELWLPSLEAAFLRSIGHLEIGRVFIQPGGYKDKSPWSERVPSVTKTLQLSYSAQLMCHAHFLSAAMPLNDRYWPMHSWWIRSMDRMMMAFSIMPIAAIDGIRLISYGEGCAYIQGPPGAIAMAIEKAPHLQLVPTQSAWAACDPQRSEEISADPSWCPDEAGGIPYSVYEKNSMSLSRREIGLTLRLDDASLLALASEEDALQAITQIMRGLKSGKSY